jgi:hypothetical protein
MARRCARPTCSDPAAATLRFDYRSRQVWLQALDAESDPAAHDLCDRHADRTEPPVGWELDDRRPPVRAVPPLYRAEAS